jgi:hypothetical protein
MIAVIEFAEHSVAYSNVLSIGRALSYNGVDVKVWDSRGKPLLQMVEELNPYLIFSSTDIVDRVASKLADKGVRIVKTESFKDDVICDPLSYKKMGKSNLFKTDEVCIVQFPDVEDRSNVELRKRLSADNKKGFRVFCDVSLHGHKYCGKLPIELHSLAFCSADSVFTLSEHVAINAFLCNENVTLIGNKYSPTREYIVLNSNLSKSIEYNVDTIDASFKVNNFFEAMK